MDADAWVDALASFSVPFLFAWVLWGRCDLQILLACSLLRRISLALRTHGRDMLRSDVHGEHEHEHPSFIHCILGIGLNSRRLAAASP